MCVLIFSKSFAWNISHSKKNWARYDKCRVVFLWTTGYSCQILMKVELFRHVFEHYSNINFHENPPNGSRVVPYGRTDVTKSVVAFRISANAPVTLPTDVVAAFISLLPYLKILEYTRLKFRSNQQFNCEYLVVYVHYPEALGHAVAGRLRVRFPDGVNGIFRWHNPSGRTMALGSAQPLNRNEYQEYFLGG
jgi:hypothetical protein